MTTPAQRALARGLTVLDSQFGTVVLLDCYPGRQFRGLIEEARFSNELGAGGFLPGQEAVLYLPTPQFEGLGFRPWPGLRLRVLGRDFVVSGVGLNDLRYALQLTVAHPKASDVPGPSFVLRYGNRLEPALTDIVLPPETALTWDFVGFEEQLAYGDRPAFAAWTAGGYGYVGIPEYVSPVAGIVTEATATPISLAGALEGYTEPAGTLFCQRLQLGDDPDKIRVYRTKTVLAAAVSIRVIPAS